jgi:hypothetical protein
MIDLHDVLPNTTISLSERKKTKILRDFSGNAWGLTDHIAALRPMTQGMVD